MKAMLEDDIQRPYDRRSYRFQQLERDPVKTTVAIGTYSNASNTADSVLLSKELASASGPVL